MSRSMPKPTTPTPSAIPFMSEVNRVVGGRPGMGAAPTTEQIARRAYEIFEARGGQHGRDLEDWLQAERELRLGRP
jgi:Protein of unknown function (DUF2934)